MTENLNTDDLAGQFVDGLVQMSKARLRSKTVWGLITTGITALVHLIFNFTISDQLAQAGAAAVVDLLCYLVEFAGLALAYYGRKVAAGPLKGGEETAAKAIAKATALVLLLSVFLAGPAHASEGASLMEMSLWAYAMNLVYAMGGFTLLLAFWFWVVDKRILKGFDTREEIAKGNMAVAVYAGLSLVALALVVGLSLG